MKHCVKSLQHSVWLLQSFLQQYLPSADISALQHQTEESKKLQYDFTNHPGKDSGKQYITTEANGQVTDDVFCPYKYKHCSGMRTT